MSTYAPDTVPLGAGWNAVIYRGWELPEDVAVKWNRIADDYGDNGIFINYDWFKIWWEAFGAGKELHIVVVREGADVKGIFPCCTWPFSGTSRTRMTSMTNSHTCLYDFIIEPESRHDVLSSFIRLSYCNQPGAVMFFDCLPSRSENTQALIEYLRKNKYPHCYYSQPWAPVASVTGEWHSYFDALPGRLRNTMKRNRKKAPAAGLSFEVIDDAGKLDESFDTFLDVEYNCWKGKSGTAIKCQKDVERFYSGLAREYIINGNLILFLLRLDGIPIAADFCLRSGSTVFLLKPGYNESYAYLSPGNLLHWEVMKYLFADPGVEKYNFLGACDTWKLEWNTETGESGWLKIYPRSLHGWSLYIFEYGWKDFLKKFRSVQRLKKWVENRKKPGR